MLPVVSIYRKNPNVQYYWLDANKSYIGCISQSKCKEFKNIADTLMEEMMSGELKSRMDVAPRL